MENKKDLFTGMTQEDSPIKEYRIWLTDDEIAGLKDLKFEYPFSWEDAIFQGIVNQILDRNDPEY